MKPTLLRILMPTLLRTLFLCGLMVLMAGLGCERKPSGSTVAMSDATKSAEPMVPLDPPPTGEAFGSESVSDPRPQALARSSLTIGGRRLTVEVADNDARRRKGLMFRQNLPPETGMLFAYAQPTTEVGFWNRNVPIDLDLAFADSQGRIHHVMQMPARSERSHSPPPGSPATQWVLEMPSGWFESAGLGVGAKMELSPALRSLRPQ